MCVYIWVCSQQGDTLSSPLSGGSRRFAEMWIFVGASAAQLCMLERGKAGAMRSRDG